MSATQTACYAGSFDPPTRGHIDLIERAARLYSHVVVAIGRNTAKQSWLPSAQRRELLQRSCAHIAGVEVVEFDDAAVACARRYGASVLVRGLRSGYDADYEIPMAEINRHHDLETVALFARAEHAHLSSGLVREVARAGLPLDDLVPPPVAAALHEQARPGSS